MVKTADKKKHRWQTFCVPRSVAPEASCYQKSWRQFWTGLATSVSQRCAHRSSSLQTSPSAPWEMQTQTHHQICASLGVTADICFLAVNSRMCSRTVQIFPPSTHWMFNGLNMKRLPGPDVQLTPVDDARELEENGEPTPHPHTVLRRYIHVITGVVLEGLPGK